MNNSRQMKAAVITGLGQLVLRNMPVPEVKPGGMLVKVSVCAVCGSDIRIFESGNERVKYPAIIGHEIAGEVAALGRGVTKFQAGDRVAIGADVPCGKCHWCLNGMGNCCPDNYAVGYQFKGGFAQYCYLEPMVVDFGPVARIPENVSSEEAALAEPLACCLNGLDRVAFNETKSVLVIGSGPIGLMLAQLVKALGSPLVIVADSDALRLEQAKLAQPDHVINGDANNIKQEVLDITKGRGADIVFTACPSVDAQEEAIDLAAKRGFINFFGGLPAGTRKVGLASNRIHYNEISVTGSHGSTPAQHRLALKMIAEERIKLSNLITHRFALDQLTEAFNVVKQRKGLKAVIKPWN